MKDKLFEEFRKSGKIKDYLKYREEVAKEFVKENDRKDTRDNSQLNRLQRKS